MVWDTLKDLRGRLVASTSDDSKVWVTSSIDGTDPVARRPEGGHALVVAVWNDHRESREVTVNMQAPTGTSFAGGTWEAPRQNPQTLGVTFNKGNLGLKGTSHLVQLTIPGRSVWKASIPLTGTPADNVRSANIPLCNWYFERSYARTKSRETGSNRQQDPEKCPTATLRCVLEHAARGEAVVTLAGKSLTCHQQWYAITATLSLKCQLISNSCRPITSLNLPSVTTTQLATSWPWLQSCLNNRKALPAVAPSIGLSFMVKETTGRLHARRPVVFWQREGLFCRCPL